MRIKNIQNLIKYKQDEIILKIKKENTIFLLESCQKVPGTFWQLFSFGTNFYSKKEGFFKTALYIYNS